MGLKDRYLTAAAGGSAAPPAPARATASAPAAAPSPPVATASATVTPAGASPAVPSAAPGGTRDLAAMRAKLAQRQSGGVNPPEAAAVQTEALFAPRTQEAPDGTAVPLVDADAASSAPAASAGTTAAPTGSPTSSGEPGVPVMTRGQKAAATRAKNRAGAATPTETPAFSAGATAALDAAVSAKPSGDSLDRIAEALERIATWLETRQ